MRLGGGEKDWRGGRGGSMMGGEGGRRIEGAVEGGDIVGK